MLTDMHTDIHQAGWQANQASGPHSLMFVKVINFLCEIRGHGGRTQGDGCQPQNLSLLSSTGTGAPWVHSTGPLRGHRGNPRIHDAQTNKGSELGKRKKTQIKGNVNKKMSQNVRTIHVLWQMGPVCIWVTMGRKNWSSSVIKFISPIRMNGLKTASRLLNGRGLGKKPCDTDTGNESVIRLAFYY